MTLPERSGRTRHDQLSKEFLHRFLPDTLRLFFPAEANELLFSTLRFVEQELLANLPQQIQRIADVVAEVQTRDGTGQVIIVHVEVEAREAVSLPRRMWEYYALLRLLRLHRVFPIALVLVPQVGGLTWQRYSEELFGHTLLTFEYAQAGIRDLPSEPYLESRDPVAAALGVLMQPQHLNKAEVKLRAWRTVAESDLSEGDKAFLVNLINTYLPREALPAEIGGTLMADLVDFELTWAERIEADALQRGRQEGRLQGWQEGRQEGRQEGAVDGKRALLLHQLRLRFPSVSDELVARVETITDEALLDRLGEQLITAVSLSNLDLPPLPTANEP